MVMVRSKRLTLALLVALVCGMFVAPPAFGRGAPGVIIVTPPPSPPPPPNGVST